MEPVPAAIDAVVGRLGELEAVLGPRSAPVLEAVRAKLISAMAARDRGDMPGVTSEISTAMNQLASLVALLDPEEAGVMRLVVQSFRSALLRGDLSQAKQDAGVMFAESGARVPDKK